MEQSCYALKTATVVIYAFLLTLLLPKGRRWLAVVLSALTTCSIESAQYFMPNRTSSFLDILANSLGGVLGWALGILLIYCVTVRFLAQSSVK